MAKTTVELPDRLHRTLRVKAALERCSMNDIVVSALHGYLRTFRLDPGLFEGETGQCAEPETHTSPKE